MGEFYQDEVCILTYDTDLIVFPVYITNKKDPLVTQFVSQYFPDKSAEILKGHFASDVISYQLGDKRYVLVYVPEGQGQFVLSSILSDVFLEIEKYNPTRAAIGLFGISEYGYDESESAHRQFAKMEEFHQKHQEMELAMVTPSDDFRPTTGEHLGDGIVPNEKANPDDIKDKSSHHLVALNLKSITSYRDYFLEYIKARSRQKETIRMGTDDSIDGINDLQWRMSFYEKKPGPENLSKWNGPVKSKDGEVEYYPVPGKSKLKLIVMLLDMSHDEAVTCLNFFGYGLARFDKEDIAYSYMLKNNDDWPKPINMLKANATLVKRFGKKAAIFENMHGKEKR